MDGRFLLLVLGFAPCPVLPFAREKARQLVSVIVLGVRSDARYEGSRRPFVSIPPSVLELRLVNQSINQSLSCQSLHMLAILARQVPRIRAKSLSPTRPFNRAWFSPLSMRCLRPCTPPVRLFSVYSLRVQPSIRHIEGLHAPAHSLKADAHLLCAHVHVGCLLTSVHQVTGFLHEDGVGRRERRARGMHDVRCTPATPPCCPPGGGQRR
eukprot:scaffold10136_cov126-Isochrysis_galbana.AAC.6